MSFLGAANGRAMRKGGEQTGRLPGEGRHRVTQASSPAGSPGVLVRSFRTGGGTPSEPAAGTAALRHPFAILVALLAIAGGPVLGADRHVGPVVSIVSHGGQVFSASQGGVFSERDGECRRLLRPLFRAFGLAVVPPGETKGVQVILVGGIPGESGVVALLDTATGKSRERKVSEDVVYDVAVSPDGRTAAMACADSRVLTLELAKFHDGGLKEWHKHTADARAVAWSPDGSRLVSGGLDGVLLVSRSDGKGEARILQEHSAGVESLAFSPDGRFFASGSRDAKVRIHTTAGGYVRTYTWLGMEAMRSGLERKPYVVALTWGGPRGALIAGVSTGGLYRLAEENADWKSLGWRNEGPVFSLTFEAKGSLVAGLDGGLKRLGN